MKELQTEFSFWYAKLSIPEEQFVFDFIGSLEVSHLGMKFFVAVVVFLDFLDQFRGILVVDTWFMVVLDTTWVRKDCFFCSLKVAFCGCLERASATTFDFPNTGIILKLKSTTLSS